VRETRLLGLTGPRQSLVVSEQEWPGLVDADLLGSVAVHEQARHHVLLPGMLKPRLDGRVPAPVRPHRRPTLRHRDRHQQRQQQRMQHPEHAGRGGDPDQRVEHPDGVPHHPPRRVGAELRRAQQVVERR